MFVAWYNSLFPSAAETVWAGALCGWHQTPDEASSCVVIVTRPQSVTRCRQRIIYT